MEKLSSVPGTNVKRKSSDIRESNTRKTRRQDRKSSHVPLNVSTLWNGLGNNAYECNDSDISSQLSSVGHTRDGRTDLTNFEMELHDTRFYSAESTQRSKKGERQYWIRTHFLRPACVPITVVAVFMLMVVVFPISNDTESRYLSPNGSCAEECRIELVESIPENLTYPEARDTLDMTAFYWTLEGGGESGSDPSDWMGKSIFDSMKTVGNKLHMRIAQDIGKPQTTAESTFLARKKLAKVRSLNMSRWFGSGVLHTKLWVADSDQVYIGSANMDWRSLAQVKELGARITNCTCIGVEAQKLFNGYWYMGAEGAVIPRRWPADLATVYNAYSPMEVSLNGIMQFVYLSLSPPKFLPPGRESDLYAITDTISRAKRFVRVAVMDYSPSMLYTKERSYWPYIDDALRAAAYRGIEVQLLFSNWTHTKHSMFAFARSLLVLNDALPKHSKGSVEVRLFEVPIYTEAQAKIPFARVNHNKYMVTDNTAYIGTSNWSGDYFTDTGGVGLVIRYDAKKVPASQYNATVAGQLNQIFLRDWNSDYARTFD